MAEGKQRGKRAGVVANVVEPVDSRQKEGTVDGIDAVHWHPKSVNTTDEVDVEVVPRDCQ